MSISDLTRQATIFAPAPFAHQHDIPELGIENCWLTHYCFRILTLQLLILSAFVLVEESELAGDLEDLALVLDHIVAPYRSRLGTAILSDCTA
jgi:hypothetical protein